MKIQSVFIFMLILIFQLSETEAQFGIRLKYNNQNLTNWTNEMKEFTTNEKKIFNPGYEIGLDYWFKLKKRRIEFMPELAYTMSNTSFISGTGIDAIRLTGYNLNFHTQIYALDMEGDCDCPTFSKQGPSINKGLFFHFTPGLGYYTTASTLSENTTISADEMEEIVFRAGLGIGMDIGVSDLLTVTPIISYYFHSKMEWDNMPVPGRLMPNISDNLKVLQFTVRLGFRPDYGSGGRRRR